VDRIAGWLKSDFEKSGLNSVLSGAENMTRAKYFMAEERYHAALAALKTQSGRYGAEAFLLGKLETTVMRAVCLYHIKDREGALHALREAYAASLTDDLDMPFIEAGKDMRTLTSVALKDPRCAVPGAWLEKIRRRSSTYAKKLAYVMSSYRSMDKQYDARSLLTKKELEILTDLYHGLSRSEISANHGLSINTVKAMIPVIYKKLGAANVAEAIRVAVTLNLI
ncbi:MAG: LuxR C-terminal-related transcriptional regulator, partial [Clostridiales bacterium]|jgi:DNA-binding NarL/FixJ family response regulator|nr:LuxR C-terminal-related transcriptional regulator [Clostridiales bacterium]